MNAHWWRRRRDTAGRPHRQRTDPALGTVILTLAAGALLTVTTGLAAMVELEQFGPSVGGIIVFRPDTAATERWSLDAAIAEPARLGLPWETSGRHCVLSPNVMAVFGRPKCKSAQYISRYSGLCAGSA